LEGTTDRTGIKRRDLLIGTAVAVATLIAVPHLSFPGVGHIKTSGDGLTWVPIPYENRDFSKDATFLDPHKNDDKP
jgi:hypothetical protein